jgi:hypothetical protein
MQYFVIAPDGNQYGPATVEVLKQWVQEGRLTATTTLRDATTQAVVQASNVPGLFASPAPVAPAPPVYQSAPMQSPAGPYAQAPTGPVPNLGGPGQSWSQAPTYSAPQPLNQEGSGALWGSLIRSALAVVFFFALRGIGLVFALYAVFYGYKAMSEGHRFGVPAFVISLLALAAVGIGWFIRFQTHSY